MSSSDIAVLRDRVKEYLDICAGDCQLQRRKLWSEHNSLKKTRTLIYVREGNAYQEVVRPETLRCSDLFFRFYENWIAKLIYQDTIGDDYVFEPWLTVRAVYAVQGWGFERSVQTPDHPGGAYKFNHPLKSLEDLEKMKMPRHAIDEDATRRQFDKLRDAVGDLIAVHLDRAPAYRMWTADISTTLGELRGIENVMLDMMDNPQWLHRLLKYMSDGVLKTHDQAEQNGDWSLAEHQNQAMPYAEELPWPKADSRPVLRKQLWGYCAAQELTLVSPQMHNEFMLQYQIPLMAPFGLVAYGCCEDLSDKIDILRQIKNLRRIAVAPRANLARCVEQIKDDYVISWRPNPAEMVCCGFEPDQIKKTIQNALNICKGCHMDITLKDINTVENDPDRLKNWVNIVREVIDATV